MTPTFRWFLDSCDIVCMTISLRILWFQESKMKYIMILCLVTGASPKFWDTSPNVETSSIWIHFIGQFLFHPNLMPSAFIYMMNSLYSGWSPDHLKVNPYKRRYKTLLLGWWVYPYYGNNWVFGPKYIWFFCETHMGDFFRFFRSILSWHTKSSPNPAKSLEDGEPAGK